MNLTNKPCRICKQKPAAIGRLMCMTCKNKRVKRNNKVLKTFNYIKDDTIVERVKPKNGYHKKEFWIETPHKIKRDKITRDEFNGFY